MGLFGKKKEETKAVSTTAGIKVLLVVNEKVVAMGKVLKAAEVEKLLHKLRF